MVSEENLLQGAWYALEQAGRLLSSSVALFDRGDASTALAVAMFGREELGRSRLLRELASQVSTGKQLRPGDVTKLCEDHVRKQTASASSTVLRIVGGTAMEQHMRAYQRNSPASPEWKQASSVIDQALKSKRKRDPHERHTARMRALYVDFDSSGKNWVRPASVDASLARNEIEEFANDYSLECDRFRDSSVTRDFPTMAAAREKMQPRPDLPVPVWPMLPASTG